MTNGMKMNKCLFLPLSGPSATFYTKQIQGDEQVVHWVTVLDKNAITFELKTCGNAQLLLSSSVGAVWLKTYHIQIQDMNDE